MTESKLERKQAVRQYRERKIPRGIYAVRCSETGRVWVGASPNLDAAKNRAWFGLGLGTAVDRTLQEAWNQFGAAAFIFEVLETLKDDVTPMAVPDLLKEKRSVWQSRLNAEPLL